MSNHLVVGVLAPVDAGKTTLIEALLYESGRLREKGRVDHGNAFLDTEDVEKSRGITVYAKQARFSLGETLVTLVDTPGHRDFSAEMERTIAIMDYAILVISASDGVTGYAKMLMRLLKEAQVPTFVFLNKMDQAGTDAESVLKDLSETFGDGVLNMRKDNLSEEIVFSCDAFLEKFEKGEEVTKKDVAEKIRSGRLLPVYPGSALHFEGIREFIQGLSDFLLPPTGGKDFSGRVAKISRNGGLRLTHLKVTGGSLKVRDEVLPGEKVTEIRIYDGTGYQTVPEAVSGMYVAVAGLKSTRAGMTFGSEKGTDKPALLPLISSRILYGDEVPFAKMKDILMEIEEEMPEIHVRERKGLLHVDIMGDLQKDILKGEIYKRSGISIGFGEEAILYKETVSRDVIGVGHYEPLRHYAEVHVLITPLKAGSGIEYENGLYNSQLPINFQNQILSHLKAKVHKGVLTGAPLTDVRLTLVAGVSSAKHTAGGDFREATWRAVRQGLMEAGTVLLEPVVAFEILVPGDNLGRVLNDISLLEAKMDPPVLRSDDMARITGRVSLRKIRGYGRHLAEMTGGAGHMVIVPDGYAPAKDPLPVIRAAAYDAEGDLENPSGSIFCVHGAGVYVPWSEVKDCMQAAGGAAREEERIPAIDYEERERRFESEENELREIFARTYRKGDKVSRKYQKKKKKADAFSAPRTVTYKPGGKTYLLVDGYNIIFQWDDLKQLAEENIEAARNALMDICADYQGAMGNSHELILVYDAYKVPGGKGAISTYKGIYVVYTKEAETADAYIEKTVHDMDRRHRVTVATSDGMEQRIVLGAGAARLSAREFREEVLRQKERMRAYMDENTRPLGNYSLDRKKR